jgi:hypothetical protein
MSDKHGYMSMRTDAEWGYLFTAASLVEVRTVADEIIAAAEDDPTNAELRRDLQRVTRARLNAGARAVS